MQTSIKPFRTYENGTANGKSNSKSLKRNGSCHAENTRSEIQKWNLIGAHEWRSRVKRQ